MGYKFEKYSIGGGGSGIIDVTELPTENIDENAVYRLTSSASTEMYFGGEQDGTLVYYTVAEFWPQVNIPYIPKYTVVDTIPSSWNCINQETMVAEVYIDKATGIGYLSDGTTSMPLSAVTSGAADRGWIDSLENMTAIGYYAIKGGTFITYYTYSDGVWADYIDGESARYEIEVLETMVDEKTASANFTDYAVLLGSATGIALTSVTNDQFTSITIPNSVTSIGSDVFYECLHLLSITIPDSVTSIGDRAFRFCQNLASITIPDSVTSIGEEAISYCNRLASITIPNSITILSQYVFAGCHSLTSVTIPDSVTSINNGVFQYCNNLASVTIPNSVTSIGSQVFENCENLTSINYNGTKEQWKAITFGIWDEGTPDYIITCTDGTIAKDGTET